MLVLLNSHEKVEMDIILYRIVLYISLISEVPLKSFLQDDFLVAVDRAPFFTALHSDPLHPELCLFAHDSPAVC